MVVTIIKAKVENTWPRPEYQITADTRVMKGAANDDQLLRGKAYVMKGRRSRVQRPEQARTLPLRLNISRRWRGGAGSHKSEDAVKQGLLKGGRDARDLVIRYYLLRVRVSKV